MRIGFFDSGVGGLTVLHEAMKAYPKAEYLYYADTDNVPYGIKSEVEIKKLVFKAIDFLLQKKVDIVVLACNTATSVCISDLRAKYSLPIVGMEPAIKPATQHLQFHDGPSRILITATKRTLKQKKLDDLIHSLKAEDQVELLALQKLVKYAENKIFKGAKIKKYLKSKFNHIDWQDHGSIVLGCTHFIYYRPLLKKLLPDHIAIIDGNEGTVNRMLHHIENLAPTNAKIKSKLKYYQSGRKKNKNQLKPYLNYLEEQCK